MIFSIFSITSGVNLANASNAFKLSSNCCFFVAPKIAVLTFGFFMHHAILNAAVETPNLSASSVNFLLF